MIDKRILDAIDYHTRRLEKTFRLRQFDRDDVRQTLILAALEAGQTYDPSHGTKRNTYIKAAVGYRAVDILRNLERTPQVICQEEGSDLQDTERYYRKINCDIHQGLSDPDMPKSQKPLQLNCGTYLQNIAVTPDTFPSDFKLDLLAILDKLQPRQRVICVLLIEGFIYKEIAARLGIHKNTVQRDIMEIRQLFIEHQLGKFWKNTEKHGVPQATQTNKTYKEKLFFMNRPTCHMTIWNDDEKIGNAHGLTAL